MLLPAVGEAVDQHVDEHETQDGEEINLALARALAEGVEQVSFGAWQRMLLTSQALTSAQEVDKLPQEQLLRFFSIPEVAAAAGQTSQQQAQEPPQTQPVQVCPTCVLQLTIDQCLWVLRHEGVQRWWEDLPYSYSYSHGYTSTSAELVLPQRHLHVR